MTSLRPLALKLAAVAILAFAVSIPCLAGYAFVSVLEGKQQKIADHAAQLVRLESIARYRPKLAAAEDAKSQKLFIEWFLPQNDPGLAAAALQDRVRSLAEAHSVEITRAGEAPLKTIEGVVYAGITLDMTGDADGLQALFGDMEAAQPFLIVEQFAMQAEPGAGDPRYDPIRLYATVEIRAALP